MNEQTNKKKETQNNDITSPKIFHIDMSWKQRKKKKKNDFIQY